jgi:hypothetical protein
VTLKTYVSNTGLINSLAKADNIRSDTYKVGEGIYPTFNTNNTSGEGFYALGNNPPGLPAADVEDFAVVGTGFLEVRNEGDYRFASLSDDGARLKIDGATVINDDTLHGAGFPGDVKIGTVHLTPGFHPIEYMWFERGGGAGGELFLMDANNNPIALVGDHDNGGLRVVQQVPEPSTLVLGGLGLFGLALGWIRKKFKK